MKTTMLIISCVLMSFIVVGQTTKREYYDYQKTALMAEYQVNSSGQKHGWFKGYDQQGILVYEYNYKNDLWHGLNTEYVTVGGKRVIAQSETYKDGVLEGPAKYYGNGIVIRQGSYTNDARSGEWTLIESYTNYDLSDEEKKGSEYVKSVVNYNNGEMVLNGKLTTHFYPSGKVRTEQEFINGKKIGHHKWYFPSGQLENEELYDESGKMIMYKSYHPNGQVRKYSDWRNGTYIEEGYNSDGTPDRAMQQNLETKKQEEEKKRKAQLVVQADSLLLAGNTEAALALYKEGGYNPQLTLNLIRLETSFNAGTVEKSNELNFNNTVTEKQKDDSEKATLDYLNQYSRSMEYKQATTAERTYFDQRKQIITDKANAVTQVILAVNQKYTTYLKTYTAPGTSVGTTLYLYGEDLYLKTKEVIDEYIAAYGKSVAPDDKIKTAHALIMALDKMIDLVTKPENKANKKLVKKAETKDQVKAILGL